MEIEYLGIKMDVVFSFDRQESQTQDYVGSADSVEINEIKINSIGNIKFLILNFFV